MKPYFTRRNKDGEPRRMVEIACEKCGLKRGIPVPDKFKNNVPNMPIPKCICGGQFGPGMLHMGEDRHKL